LQTHRRLAQCAWRQQGIAIAERSADGCSSRSGSRDGVPVHLLGQLPAVLDEGPERRAQSVAVIAIQIDGRSVSSDC
jgi:hypothetical protein